MTTYTQLELIRIDPRRDDARSLRRAGLTMRQIEEHFPGVPRTRLLGWVRDIHPARHKLRVRAKDEVREQARQLRLKDKTYAEIAAELGVSKSSVSVWCNDLPRPTAPPRSSANHRDWEPYRRRREREREAERAEAARAVGSLTEREMFLLGVAWYWAEGAKDKPWQRREQIKFSNSDPDVIRFFNAWLDLLGAPEADRDYRLYIHETADVAASVEFWANVLRVPPLRMSKPTLKRHRPLTNRKNTAADYHGCLNITVRRSSGLYRRVAGSWRAIAADGLRFQTVGR